ncbi:hypothetical protein ACWD4G_03000 [Streptomyces sp. NPDC002643]
MTIGERIRAAREARRPKRSQEKLANELSVARWGKPGFLDRQQVYRWGKGRRVPRAWLPFIEQVLNIDLSEDNETQLADTVTSVILLGGSDVDRRQFLVASAAVGLAALDLPDAEAITRRANRFGPVAVRP